MTRADHNALDELSPALRELLDRLPREPGVYLLKDKKGRIIYVGKAKSLHARVRSYFTRSGDTRFFVPALAGLLGDVETIVTRNEKEALLLENNLIKKHKPRFNVMLRDDKNYLVLRIDPKANYPRIEVTRSIRDDHARYFGPYHSASSCRETLRVVNRHFQLRTCTDRTMASRARPCLQYQIGRCPAPCVFEVDREQYQRQVEDVSLFLRGRADELVASLEGRMKEAATELNFEHAAHMRDQITAVKRSLMSQQTVGDEIIDQDVFGFFREGAAVDIVVLVFREGKLLARRPYSFSGQEFPDHELLSSFIGQYYESGEELPDLLIVPTELEDAESKLAWLDELRQQREGDTRARRVSLVVPKRGKKRKLLELAQRNAHSNFLTRRKRADDVEAALSKLQQRLRLETPPRRIECYDISGMGGELMVGSMVVLQDAVPEPASYRHFKVRLEPGQIGDDFAAMYQVLARRLRRARDDDEGWSLPDLIVVDGGKGQLGVALAAMKDAGFAPESALPPIIGLAKERQEGYRESAEARRQRAEHEDQTKRSERSRPDRVFLPGVKDPIRLRPNTAELYLLSLIRDEAHRFAITYHKKLRRKRTLRSGLDDVPGIGPKRKRQLLKTFGSLKKIRAASVEELARVPGMSSKAAEAVASYLGASLSEAEAEG
ncbi:MAG: excinuclease ABC subunit UvrC [Myxococcales bacterium]|nr:excinuclease ABC subunit UvrC [Myxococcales bacterium]